MPKLRSEINDSDKWAVNDIYENDALWEKSLEALQEKINAVKAFQGKLNNADDIAEFYKVSEDAELEMNKLYTYAHMKHDEDTANSEYRSMQDRIYSICIQYDEETAWVTPEIIAIDDNAMADILKSEKILPYKFSLEKLLRQKKYVLSEKEERILSAAGLPLSAASEAFSALNDADMKFPMVKDSAGNDCELSHGTYSIYLRSADRELRKNAFLEYHKKYNEFSNTLTTLLQGEIRNHVFSAKTRGYDTALDAAVFGKNIDRSVYTNLIKTVHDNIHILHKYIKYRKEKLGVDQLHFYDLYVPLAEHEEIKLTYDEARNLVLEAVKPLGKQYSEVLHKGLYEERWVDIYENENKRSGAYSTGSYLTRPYILMNYNGTLDSARTLAHEAGHSMHSWFTHNTQSPTYGSYPIFLAEVASTFNEEMMNNYLLQKHGDDKKFKVYLLTSMIEDIRATLFRQTLFAEFELKLHEMAENGIPFTADLLKKEYMDLYRFYYGEELVLDDELAIEWARIPHFYYDYYVYQYATGISAAIALYQRVSKGGSQELEDYLGFLKAGNSRYPLDILRSAGVDMSKPEPIAAAISYFDELLTLLQNC